MRRDLPEGCDYAAYPSFGFGRVLTAPRMAAHLSEVYCSLRLRGAVYVLILGRYWERRSVSFVRWTAAGREDLAERITEAVEREAIAEDARLDARKASNREARRAALRDAIERGLNRRMNGNGGSQ